MWHLYVLINEGKPIYVGVSYSVKDRIKQHIKSGKQFDKHIIIESFAIKESALAAERCLIKYLSLFGDESITNKKYERFEQLKTYL